MKKNNLNALSDKIVKTFIVFLLISIAMSAMLFLYVMNKNIEEQELFFKKQVDSANKVLQYNIYNQINTLINNQDFLSFIFSGDLTRQRHYGDILLLVSNLDYTLIKGIEIVKYNPVSRVGDNILKYGNITNYYVNLNVCYLNSKANTNLGDCTYKHINFMIYFDSIAYINQLNLIDPIITIRQKSQPVYKFYPFNEKLAKFDVKNYSTTPLLLDSNIDNKSNRYLIILAIPFFSIMLLVYYFSHRMLRGMVETKLIIPLRNIATNLNKGLNIPIDNGNIIELNNLINVANTYHLTQLNNRLNKISARVAHDIKSPLAVIELSIADIFNKNDPIYKIIKNALKSSRSIVNNMLLNFSGKISSESIFDEKKSYILLTEIIEEIVSLKSTEWSKSSRQFTLNYNFDILLNSWIFLSATEFKRHISNLLQNSFEAIHGNSIDIMVNISSMNNVTKIAISDNGTGMSSKTLECIKFGQSSKQSGHGIGLESAITYFRQEHGSVEIQSTIDTGTTIDILLNIPSKPIWFTEIISVNKNLVIIDDEKSMLDFWTNKFSKMNLNVKVFSSPHQFQDWYVNLMSDLEYTFIVDYDYNDTLSGVDIIRTIKTTQNCFLITSSYSECEIQSEVTELNIKLIPKYLLSETTILLKQQ